uniref:Calcium homeostasis modulator family member 6 n=1 Tax=Spermophilus dauricus TaxID=99837 RepID=A0A8C9PQD6_SPEDA
MEKFKTVLDLHLRHSSALGYGLVTLLTASGERIFSAVVFQCPCSATWNLPYGLVFLLVPALVLFLLGYMLSARTWRLLTGCCRHLEPALRLGLPVGASACALPPGLYAERSHVAPTDWLRSKVLEPYLCRNRTGCTDQLPLVPCSKDQKSDLQDLLKELKAQSQVLGWIIIAVVIIVVVILTSVCRCLSPVSFLQLKFWKIYLENEQEIFKSQAKEHATELAKENVKCFFERSHPKEYNTPSIKDWQQISTLYTFNPKDQYYSMLHKYVNRKEESDSIKSSEGDEMLPVLGFVDSPGINISTGL